MKALFLIAATTSALIALPSLADVYREVDANGNVTFTDEPGDKAERVNVKPVTTITLPKPDTVRRQLTEEGGENGDQQAYESVSFTAPTEDEAFWTGGGNVEFRVTSTPGLRQGHQFEITLDSQPVGQTRSGTVTVNNVFRGTHSAGVNVIGPNGERIYTGDRISFTVHRPSALN